jgi:parvulin-like peptidyl-prolyl isomerase
LLKKVLVKVGERNITLGDYVETLERMNEFERLRYQSPDRRRALLDQMIDVELLAAEAERRGLDQHEKTRARINQALRDELLGELKRGLPAASELSSKEVRRYYDEHRSDFFEPERRRLAHIKLRSKKTALEVLAEAKKATPAEWGHLVRKHSIERQASSDLVTPLELAGDLGIVSLSGPGKGVAEGVHQELRRAVFTLKEIGDVFAQVIEIDGAFHIVRMLGKTDARQRTFAEAERIVRARLLEKRARAAEAELEASLRKKYPVKIDEAELKKVALPGDKG